MNLELVVDVEEAGEEDDPLRDEGRDHHGEGDGGEAVALQEGHQEAEAGEQHHVDVHDH